jgi:hypothetical protein
LQIAMGGSLKRSLGMVPKSQPSPSPADLRLPHGKNLFSSPGVSVMTTDAYTDVKSWYMDDADDNAVRSGSVRRYLQVYVYPYGHTTNGANGSSRG